MYRAGVWVRCFIVSLYLLIHGASEDVSCPVLEPFEPNVFKEGQLKHGSMVRAGKKLRYYSKPPSKKAGFFFYYLKLRLC